MDYENFKWSLLEAVRNRTGRSVTVRLQRVPGINGTDYDGITLTEGYGQLSPVITLRPYYDSYRDGTSLTHLADDIIARHSGAVRESPLPFRAEPDFEDVKGAVFFKVINKLMNHALLEKMPHVDFADLSVIFYFRLNDASEEEMSVMISYDDIKRWDISEKTLFDVATENMVNKKTVKLITLEEALFQMTEELKAEEALSEDSESDKSLYGGRSSPDCATNGTEGVSPLKADKIYLLTCHDQLYGAACLFYPGLLKSIAAGFRSDFLIIPSSVHEVLVVSDSQGLTLEDLRDMVCTVNEREVMPQEVLSYHIYRYNREGDNITVAI